MINDRPVGYLFGSVDPTPPARVWYYMHPHTQGTVEELFVTSEYRHKGIGTALMKQAEIFFRKHKCNCVSLGVLAFNKHAIKLYKKIGFSPRSLILSKN